ncbi:zinc finger A20 and AN1 domain-containing stress-associated protein [Musa troglodytarum]|nr:zinc finger A20 and AN1 domain-containing stress-associated protein [Musa troglodytarum]
MDSGEHRENHSPCASGCGFFGSPRRAACALGATETSASWSSSRRWGRLWPQRSPRPGAGRSRPSSSYPGEEPPKAADRCGRCKKKVRLCARFECRCGSTFCAAHRLPETHECAFDYKAHGRAAIARANPVVVKDKLRRI